MSTLATTTAHPPVQFPTSFYSRYYHNYVHIDEPYGPHAGLQNQYTFQVIKFAPLYQFAYCIKSSTISQKEWDTFVKDYQLEVCPQ